VKIFVGREGKESIEKLKIYSVLCLRSAADMRREEASLHALLTHQTAPLFSILQVLVRCAERNHITPHPGRFKVLSPPPVW
jgi:hypothetical protein